MLPGPLIVLIVHTLFAFGQAYAVLTNITIDDTNSIFWTFEGAYNVITSSTPCNTCLINPDPGSVYNNSWHDGALQTGSFVFQGTAVYIYGIDCPFSGNLTFRINNSSHSSSHLYPGDTYVYDSLFFSATDLDANVLHTVSWSMGWSASGGSGLFDYAVATADRGDVSGSASTGTRGDVLLTSTSASSANSTTSGYSSTSNSTTSTSPSGSVSPQKKSKTGAIVGAVVGVVVVVAILGALFVFLRRRRSTTTGYIDRAPNPGVTSGNMSTIVPYPTLVPPARPGIHIKNSDSRLVLPSPSVSTVSASSNVPSSPAVLEEVQERLRNLEQLVAASQPPEYS
ncbi:hypothetical protein B0H19DRAFT_1244196 [Mycena capillaripes]|nr:hypothetical protein B0H19DRAFT_1244196 [Mycena capillaripes]